MITFYKIQFLATAAVLMGLFPPPHFLFYIGLVYALAFGLLKLADKLDADIAAEQNN